MKERIIPNDDVGLTRRNGVLRAMFLITILFALAGTHPTYAQVDIAFPQPPVDRAINANADSIDRWQSGEWDVFHLRGNVRIRQDNILLQSHEAVVWLDAANPEGESTLVLYLENQVTIDVGEKRTSLLTRPQPASRFQDQAWFGRLRTSSGIQFSNFVQEIAPDNAPLIFERGMVRRQQDLDKVSTVQYLEPATTTVVSPLTGEVQVLSPQMMTPSQQNGVVTIAPGNPQLSGIGQFAPPQSTGTNVTTDVKIVPRDSKSGSNLKIKNGSLPNERVLIFTGGANVSVDSTELQRIDQMGQPKTSKLVIQADNVVAWETPVTNPDGSIGSRYEIYLEGNIVFAQGNRVVYADRMYYDATYRRGTILNADVLTPVPSYNGLLRLKADVVQQLDDDNMQAFGAAITSSRLGVPRYWLQSDQLNLTRTPRPNTDPVSGLPLVDPATGQLLSGDDYFVQSANNRVYVAGIPVFYWPNLNTDLNNPNYFIERVRIGNDSIYGFQLGVGFDLYQMLGIRNRPANGRWIGNLDYLSDRGFGFGTDLDYRGNSFLGLAGQTEGVFRSWFINDSGLDNLGLDRRMVPLEKEFRGRAHWRHRQTFVPGFSLRAEFGYLSDQNFLQQYYEKEWDHDKDYTSGLWLERNAGAQSWNLTADIRVNDFFTQTSWLPRFDHFVVGQPILFDRAVWHAHSTAGYAKFRTADAPTNAIDLAKFDPLGWEGVNREGAVASTRHEIDFPIQMGAMKLVPYVLGDLSYWQEDLNGDDLLRAYGQAGIRSSLPMWRVDPTIHSTLLNLNGLAHKVSWENEFLYADSSQDMDRLPLYNQLDDDAQEFFRRRFAFDTFGIAAGMDAPLRFDERYFAFRSGTQSNVTTPASEIADDLSMIRSGFRNRWQTKRGLPGEARIIDWITFDVHYNFYPDAARDNFGADFGMLDYDFRWHIGDRLSVVSDGYFDFFGQGLRTASIGTHMSRPGVGNLYLGFRSIEGPISSNVISASATYRMNDKWVMQGSSSYDFGDAGNIGQALNFVRVGESFLVSLGVRADISRDNVGLVFAVEPRFLPSGRLGLVGGQRIQPASSRFLE